MRRKSKFKTVNNQTLLKLLKLTRNNQSILYTQEILNSELELPTYLSEHSLGMKLFKKIYFKENIEDPIINIILQKLLINIQSRFIYFFNHNDKSIPQVSDFLKEMAREMTYCQINGIPYTVKDIYLRSISTLSESTLHHHKCPECENKIISCRTTCTDLICSCCNLRIEVKSKGKPDSEKSKIIINSGLPEGVTEWKRLDGKLIILKENGYYMTNAKNVSITGYIENLPEDWSINPNYHLNTSRKSKMIVDKQQLERLDLNIDFKWSDHILMIVNFLDKLYSFNNMGNGKKFSHLEPIKMAIYDFESKIYFNHKPQV